MTAYDRLLLFCLSSGALCLVTLIVILILVLSGLTTAGLILCFVELFALIAFNESARAVLEGGK